MDTTTELGGSRFTLDRLRAVLSSLNRLKTSLTFHVTDGKSERVFYFVNGGIRVLSTGPHKGPGLCEILLASGATDVDSLHSAIEDAKTEREDLRRILARKKLVDKDTCEKIVQSIVRDSLYEMVFWNNAFCISHSHKPPAELFQSERGGIQATIDGAQLARDTLRWLKEWKELRATLHSELSTICVNYNGRKASGAEPSDVKRLLEFCSEPISIRDLWMSSALPLNDVCHGASYLVEKKMAELTPVPSSTRLPVAEEIEVLEASVRTLIAKDLARERLAYLYRKNNQPEKAAEQLEFLGDALLRDDVNETERAAQHFKDALSVSPNRASVFEKLIAIIHESGDTRELRAIVLKHLQRLIRTQEFEIAEKCGDVLERVCGLSMEAIEYRANLLAARDKTREASAEFLRLAKMCDDQGRSDQSTYYLKQALGQDQKAQRAKEREREQPERKKGKRPKKRVKKKVSTTPGAGTSEPSSESRTSGQRGGALRAVAAILVLAGIGAGLYYAGLLDRWLKPGITEAESKHPPSTTSSFVAASGSSTGTAPQTPEAGSGTITARPSGGVAPADVAPLVTETVGSGTIDRGPDPGSESSLGGPEVDSSNGRPLTLDTESPLVSSADPVPRDSASAYVGETASDSSGSLDAGTDASRDRDHPDDSSQVASAETSDSPCHDIANYRSRPLTSTLAATYADGCTAYIQNSTGEIVAEFGGEPNTLWAFGFRGRAACRWKPGGEVRVFSITAPAGSDVGWRVPRETESLAIGPDRILIREGDLTALFALDGSPIASRTLSEWDEGYFVRGTIVLTRHAENDTSVWVVDAKTLTPIWQAHEDRGDIVVR